MLTCFIQAQDSLTVIDRVIELSNNNNRDEALALIEENMPIYEVEKNFEDLISLQRLKAVIYNYPKAQALSCLTFFIFNKLRKIWFKIIWSF